VKKKSQLTQAIDNLDTEIKFLTAMKERLLAVRDTAAQRRAELLRPKRTSKKTPSLLPDDEAVGNHVG
jgi:ElaB/YqjD/DUF883 family membrane-anchored ribosome-binding protein